MTEKQLRQLPVEWLQQYIDARTGSAAHKAILKVFNDSGLCRRYKMTVADPWCAATASAAMIATGLADIFPCVECSCGAMIELAKKAGIWVENDAYIPGVGDKILYDWDDSGIGDDKGAPEHVGTVAEVRDGVIVVIEGNMGTGYVDYRRVPINGRYIRGFICPDFKSKADETASKAVKEQKEKNKTPAYKVGTNYTTLVPLNVRCGPGTGYTKKRQDQLSPDGQRHAVNGVLTAGTAVTCQAKKKVNGDVWIKIPSGWIAAYYQGENYIG